MSKENEDKSIEAEVVDTPNVEEAKETTQENKVEDSELTQLRDALAECEDKYLRTHASFENSKKLLAKDKATAVSYANESFANDILSVVDSFDSALATISAINSEEGSSEVFDKIKEGLDLTYTQLIKVLEKNHIKVVETIGEMNPEIHQAIMQVESDEHEVGDIVQVLQKGYTIKDRLLRPAMVSTAK